MNLDNAMRAFVANGCDRAMMNVDAWSATYGVEAESIRTAWEAAMTRHSQGQHNNCEEQA